MHFTGFCPGLWGVLKISVYLHSTELETQMGSCNFSKPPGWFLDTGKSENH